MASDTLASDASEGNIKLKCRIDGCRNLVKTDGRGAVRRIARGLCRTHHEAQLRISALSRPDRPICVVKDCGQPVLVLKAGLCSAHYNCSQRGVDCHFVGARLDQAKFLTDYEGPVCSVIGCSRRAASRGLCRLHRDRQKRGIAEDAPLPQQNEGRTCRALGCDRKAEDGGLCGAHAIRSRKYREDDARFLAPIAGREARTSGFRQKSKHGYISVYVPADTPGAHQQHFKRYTAWYMFEHRYVMQNWLGRSLLPREQVHHRDGNRENNHIDNLELKSGSHGNGINIIDGIQASLDWVEQYGDLDLAETAMLGRIRDRFTNRPKGNKKLAAQESLP